MKYILMVLLCLLPLQSADAWIFLGAIGDIVWYDDNRNGIQDDGELGVAGVEVWLLHAEGQLFPRS